MNLAATATDTNAGAANSGHGIAAGGEVKAPAGPRQRLDRVRADIKALAERLEAAIARQES